MSYCAITSLRDSVLFVLPKGFGYLPEKVLLNIFKYFSEDELRKNIIPVCQRWRQAAEHPSLWKTLKFSGLLRNTAMICNKIWQYNRAKHIYIKEIKEPLILLRQICRCLQNLVSISMRHCPEITEDSLRHLVVSCQSLKSLDLKGTPFKSLIFYEEMGYSQSLSNINFSDNNYLTVANITSIILNCRKIIGFHISLFQPLNKIYLTDADMLFLFNHVAENLQALSLDCSNLGTGSYSSILKCKNLQYVCLNYAYNFDGKDFQNLFKTLGKLRTLKVRFAHQITDANVKNLFEKGRDSLSELEFVDFTGCSNLSNFGIKALAYCCPNLRALIVRNCKKIFTLESVFDQCPFIEMLNIAFCKNIHFEYVPNLESLTVLFISDEKKLKYFANCLKVKNNNLKLKLCESEYNKNYQNIYNCGLF